jgi:hypothetical protein
MSSQTIKFEYDPGRNILFTEDDYSVQTEKEVDDFILINLQKLESIGRKVYMISKIDGLRIGAGVSEYYGRRSRDVFQNHILGFARYGDEPSARMTVRTASKKAKLESNICDSREEAVRAVERMKAAAGPPAPG